MPIMSPCGGTLYCCPAQGGPTSDSKFFERAGLYDKEKWVVGDGYPSGTRPIMLYDCGIGVDSICLADEAGFELRTSGVIRKSRKSSQSAVQRIANTQTASMRIRVENFIGLVKKRFLVLGVVHKLEDLPMVERWGWLAFTLHNFSYPIIK
jgi:hypothetical protein